MDKFEELNKLFVEAVMKQVEFKDFHFNLKEDEESEEDVNLDINNNGENSDVKWLVSDFNNIWFHKTREEALETEQWLYQMHGEDENEYSSVLLKVPFSMTKEEAKNILQSGEWKKYEELQETSEDTIEHDVEDKSVELFLNGEPKKIVNCTPHAVKLILEDGSEVVIPASNNLARCESRRTTVYAFDNGVEVHRTEMGNVYGLPEPVAGTYYLVSLLVANKLKGERDDLLVTDEAVRGEGGKIIGCRAFAVVD